MAATVCVLGTGIMGFPMARNLRAAGLGVRAWNRTAERARPLEDDGAEVFDDPAEAAAGAGVVLTMLADAEAVLAVAEAALPAAAPGPLWLQMSTIGIEGTERAAALAGRTGATFVDAPVLGTKAPAEQGTLTVLASGPESAEAPARPVFDAVGARTLWLGEAGAGTRLKLVVNAWVLSVVESLAEVVGLAEALAVDPARFLDAIAGGALDLPYAQTKGKAMLERDFPPSFTLALARKDADLVRAAAERHGAEVPVVDAVARQMGRAIDLGHGDEDMAATYWSSTRR
jgi:3-hydroxyisobutyrate dehydrogenase